MFKRLVTTVLMLVVLFAAAGCRPNASSPGGSPSAGELSVPPEQVVQEFYDWYMFGEGSPAGTQTYKDSPHLSGDMLAELDRLYAEGAHADPFLLAQDIPNSVEIAPGVINGDEATVEVKTSFGTTLTLTLKLLEGAWKIDDVKGS